MNHRLVLIAAIGNNGVIGKNNDLPWPRIREDMFRFKDLTIGHPVIMGRKTYDSIPNKFKPLVGRQNLVVTRNDSYDAGDKRVIVRPNINEAIRWAERYASPIYVAGGGEIYRASIDLADVLEITHVHGDYSGDTFFPEISKTLWKEEKRVDCSGYSFVRYLRNK